MRTVKPALALLLRLGQRLAVRPFASRSHEKGGIDSAQNRAIACIHRQNRVQGNSGTTPPGAHRCRILKRQNMATSNPARRARKGCPHHLRNRHRCVVEKPRNPHLARPTHAQPPDTSANPATLNQPTQKKGPSRPPPGQALFPSGGLQTAPDQSRP